MNSKNNNIIEEHNFAFYLEKTLAQANMGLTQLAIEVGVSRQHLNLLKKGKANASGDLLGKIYQTLKTHNVSKNDIISLICSGIGIYDRDIDSLSEVKPYIFNYNPERKGLKNICILTDKLAECIYDDIFLDTIKLLQDGKEYYYFLPFSSSDWERMLLRAARENTNHEELLRNKTYCIKCPSQLIISRIRIDNITEASPKAYISFGPDSSPVIYPLAKEITSNLVNILATIIMAAKKARFKGEREVIYRSEGLELKCQLAG